MQHPLLHTHPAQYTALKYRPGMPSETENQEDPTGKSCHFHITNFHLAVYGHLPIGNFPLVIFGGIPNEFWTLTNAPRGIMN